MSKQEWHQGPYARWQDKGNYKPEDLGNVNWRKENWLISHPLRVVSKDGHYLLNYDTGEIIGVLAEGYSFYVAHDHLHVCKSDWDCKNFPDHWPEDPIGKE